MRLRGWRTLVAGVLAASGGVGAAVAVASISFQTTDYPLSRTGAVVVQAGQFRSGTTPTLDVVAADPSNNRGALLRNDGAGNFSTSPFNLYPNPGKLGYMAAGDFNQDGVDDLVGVAQGPNATNGVQLLLSNGSGGFAEASGSPYPLAHGATDIVVARLSGPGAPPSAVVAESDGFSVYPDQQAAGQYQLGTPTHTSALSGGSSGAIAAADLNGDGAGDIVEAFPASNAIKVLLQQNGSFAVHSTITLPSTVTPSALALADVTGRGKLDLIVLDSQGGTLRVLPGRGDGTFDDTHPIVSSWGVGPGDTHATLVIADVDRDGHRDAILLAPDPMSGTGDVVVLTGDGGGHFSSPTAVAHGQSLAVGDFDRNGSPDLAVGVPSDASPGSQAKVSILLNTSTPPPGVVSGSTTGVTQTSATLNGTIDSHGQGSTNYHFEYGTTPSYGTSTPTTPAPGGSGAQTVSATLSGLAPGTTYYYRLDATGPGGSVVGQGRTFATTTTAPSAAIALVAPETRLGLVRGSSHSITVRVRRLNGSQGKVRLRASGLPSDISASFSPPVLSGSGSQNVIVKFTATRRAAFLQNIPFSLVATPAEHSAGVDSATLSLLASVQLFNTRITAIGVTQGIQADGKLYDARDENSPTHYTFSYSGVPLVAGKQTLVRLLADAPIAPATGVPNVTAYLYAYSGGHPLPGSPLTSTYPASGRRALFENTTGSLADQVKSGYLSSLSGYDFILPPDWTTPGRTITLTAKLGGPDTGPDISAVGFLPCSTQVCRANGRFEVHDLRFTKSRVVTVRPVAETWTDPSTGEFVAPDGTDSVFPETAALLPVADDGFVIGPYAATVDGSDIFKANPTDAALTTRAGLVWSRLAAGAALDLAVEQFLGVQASGVLGLGSLTIGINAPASAQRSSKNATRLLSSGSTNSTDLSALDPTRPNYAVSTARNNRLISSVAHEFIHAMGWVTGSGSVFPHYSRECGGGDDNDADDQGQLGEQAFPTPTAQVASPPPDPTLTTTPYWTKQGVPKVPTDGPLEGEGTLGGVGVDLSTNPPFRMIGDGLHGAANTYDLMSYCAGVGDGAWISPHTWTKLLNIFTGQGTAQSPSRDRSPERRGRADASRSATDTVLGFVPDDGPAQLTEVVRAPLSRVTPVQSAFALVLRDRAGRMLSQVPVDARMAHTDPVLGNDAHRLVMLSGQVPAVVMNAAQSVQLTIDGKPSAELTRGAPLHVLLNAPRLRRGSKSVALRWKVTGLGQGALATTMIEYSADNGRHYRGIYMGSGADHASLPARYFSASRQARLRISVSQGLQSADAVSRAFQSPGEAPFVRISLPRSGFTMSQATSLLLSGYAFDDSGRPLHGRVLRWLVGRRLLGTGNTIAASDLPAGTQTIVLEARDRLGRRATAHVRVHVLNSAPSILTFDLRRRARPGDRQIRVRVATTVPAVMVIGARRYAVGRAPRTLDVRLPRKLDRGLHVPLTLLHDRKSVSLTLVLNRRA